MKKRFLFLFFVASLFFLSGCWDKMELEDRAYVVALGLDKNEKENFIDVTFQIANLHRQDRRLAVILRMSRRAIS